MANNKTSSKKSSKTTNKNQTKKSSSIPKQSKKLELQKNNYKIVFILVIILITIYLIYKSFMLCIYSNVPIDNYGEYINYLKITDTLKITNTEASEYIAFSNLKIRNDFKNFNYISEDNTDIYEKTIDDKKASILLSKTTKVIDRFKNTNDTDINNVVSINELLEKENINNDLDLFQYLYDKKDEKINIFTKTSQMKEYYTLRNLAIGYLPNAQEIVKVNGTYEGYIFKLKSSISVYIEKDNQLYSLTFNNREYFTDEYVMELLNTLIIN